MTNVHPTKSILAVAPTEWDSEELASNRYRERFRFSFLRDRGFASPKAFGPGLLFGGGGVHAAIERACRRNSGAGLAGIVGTDDFLASSVAAILARRLGLPGPDPRSVLLCQHKYLCRLSQREAVPEATPRFVLVDPTRPRFAELPFGYPAFVKPVRATASVLATRVENPAALERWVRLGFVTRRIARRLMRPYNDLAREWVGPEADANAFIAEEVLQGSLVTVEGYAAGGQVEFLGITDSILAPGSLGFLRFDYPSRLPAGVQERMRDIARRLVPRLGLDLTIFNVEMFHDLATDRVHVVEVNPRMAYQFADLYEKVDGVNSYEVLLALAVGGRLPAKQERGAYAAASSFVVRRFEDGRIVRMPDADDVLRLRRELPDARVRLFGRPGMRLSRVERGVESYRLAIVNLGGSSREDLDLRWARARRHLPFQFR